MEKLKFEIPSITRMTEAKEYVDEFRKNNSNINGSKNLKDYIENNDYNGWLDYIEFQKNIIADEENVPNITYFFIREYDKKIIGMTNIRIVLNEKLKRCGGNIGYSIRPSERRKGYNKVNLYLALEICQKYGIKDVMISCLKDNIGSKKTILALGGKLKNEFYDEHYDSTVENYIIDAEKSIKNYSKCYNPKEYN